MLIRQVGEACAGVGVMVLPRLSEIERPWSALGVLGVSVLLSVDWADRLGRGLLKIQVRVLEVL